MFWKKNKKKETAKPEAPEGSAAVANDPREYGENLGGIWAALTGHNPQTLIPQAVGTVLHEGGTRPPWQWSRGGMEYVVMAWPQDQPVRAGVLMGGPAGGELKPLSVFPLLEGLPNDLTVASARERRESPCGDVAAEMIVGKNPMWFFDPLYNRDRDDLTPGVTHTFWFSALALAIRKALLDEISIVQGAQYEEFARAWLKENPDKTRKDAPPLKIPVKDKRIIMPGRLFGEYHLRARIEKIQDCQLEKMPVKILYLTFPFEGRPDLKLPLFASRHVLGDYEPKDGDEIEAYAWFEGRIIDPEQTS